jgi:hypothetical protein
MPARMKIAPTIKMPTTIRGVIFPPEWKSRKVKSSGGRYHTEITMRKLLGGNNQTGTSLSSSDYGNA